MLLISALLLTVVLAAACKPGDPGRSTGAYPIEIFPEMHYQQSFKIGEPPRFLPPEGSIPVSGSFLPVGTKAEERDLPNPLPQTAEVIQRGALLYQRDCSMCHGVTGGGDGYVGQQFASYGASQPPALNSERMQALTAGEKLSSISNGFGFMPPFGHLLSKEDRWAIIAMIEAPAEQRNTALEAAAPLSSEERARRLLELRNQ